MFVSVTSKRVHQAATEKAQTTDAKHKDTDSGSSAVDITQHIKWGYFVGKTPQKLRQEIISCILIVERCVLTFAERKEIYQFFFRVLSGVAYESAQVPQILTTSTLDINFKTSLAALLNCLSIPEKNAEAQAVIASLLDVLQKKISETEHSQGEHLLRVSMDPRMGLTHRDFKQKDNKGAGHCGLYAISGVHEFKLLGFAQFQRDQLGDMMQTLYEKDALDVGDYRDLLYDITKKRNAFIANSKDAARYLGVKYTPFQLKIFELVQERINDLRAEQNEISKKTSTYINAYLRGQKFKATITKFFFTHCMSDIVAILQKKSQNPDNPNAQLYIDLITRMQAMCAAMNAAVAEIDPLHPDYDEIRLKVALSPEYNLYVNKVIELELCEYLESAPGPKQEAFAIVTENSHLGDLYKRKAAIHKEIPRLQNILPSLGQARVRKAIIEQWIKKNSEVSRIGNIAMSLQIFPLSCLALLRGARELIVFVREAGKLFGNRYATDQFSSVPGKHINPLLLEELRRKYQADFRAMLTKKGFNSDQIEAIVQSPDHGKLPDTVLIENTGNHYLGLQQRDLMSRCVEIF